MTKYRKLPSSLNNLVMLQVLAEINGEDHKNTKLREAAKQLDVELRFDLMRFLQDGGFLSYDGFLSDIAVERDAFMLAARNLHRKIDEVGVLYLDADGLPHKDKGDWPNLSRDAP